MGRTSKADRNLLSCSNNIWQLYAGTDAANNLSLPDFSILETDTGVWDATLKICDNSSVQIGGFKINQGLENCLDLNNKAHAVNIYATFGRAGEVGDQVITIKGGCHDIQLSGPILSTGRNADVVIGAWSDQCHDKSKDIDLSLLYRQDGNPVTVIAARCDHVFYPKKCKILELKNFEYELYWWAKFAAVKANLL